MSTEVIIFGCSVAKTTIYSLTGLLGGFFPFFYDLFSRQKQRKESKIELNVEFFLIKAVLIPLLAFIVTILAVAFNNITTWIAALYFGASLPVFVEKAMNTKGASVGNLDADQ
ncbi:hypothetical protein [Pseudoalteromonas gelatinilytica]